MPVAGNPNKEGETACTAKIAMQMTDIENMLACMGVSGAAARASAGVICKLYHRLAGGAGSGYALPPRATWEGLYRAPVPPTEILTPAMCMLG